MTGPALEVPLDEIKAAYDTNVFSILRVSRAVIPHMASRKQGLIVNIGSIGGEMYGLPYGLFRHGDSFTRGRPTPWSGIYASTKVDWTLR